MNERVLVNAVIRYWAGVITYMEFEDIINAQLGIPDEQGIYRAESESGLVLRYEWE